MAGGQGTMACPCVEDGQDGEQQLLPHCVCPRDDHDIVIHDETCLLFKNEKMIYPKDDTCECTSTGNVEGICECCACPLDKCKCGRAGKEVFDQWRKNRDIGAMPAVLESTHPLMKRFQETLKRFLEKENSIAEEEITRLRDELRLSKLGYEKDLGTIYRNDHDTNAQRSLIVEYEETLSKKTSERQAAEQRAKESNEKYKRAKERLEKNIVNEREATEELEALTTLCRQLEAWREETESDLTVSQRVSDKMRAEKRALADEKRELDMIIYSLSNEVWKLESKLEMFQKQLEVKNVEMEKVNDKVTAYAAELEDLELEKRRLVSLWNSVLVNIQRRDKVYDSVRDDYRALQESYKTLLSNLEITKKVAMEEMNKGKEIAMNKDKLVYDITNATKLFETEDTKRLALETQISDLTESIEMTERDEELIKSENQTMCNILKNTEKEICRRNEQKLKLDSDILTNLQECLLNDKAVESMANGIKKLRELSRKQELSLMSMENQHAKMMLDIEVHRNRQARNNTTLEENLGKVREREKEIEKMEENYAKNMLVITRKQRELDIIIKKFHVLKEIFDMKSPQERRIEELEQQIRSLRERTELLQHEWLRLQGHVVKLTAHHHKIVSDINLINKHGQIGEQQLLPHCVCPRDDHDIVIHDETCLLFKNEKMIYPKDDTCECTSTGNVEGICECCACPLDKCKCGRAGKEVFDQWRKNRDIGAMPAVLESTHPLMKRFQETLKRFLEKENSIAEEEITRLRDELRLSKLGYEKDLGTIYRNDHDTNAQRSLIVEYEETLSKKTSERQAAEQRAKESNEKYKRAKERLEKNIVNERETTEELEALTTLCRQLEAWREETESDLTVSQRVSDKMRAEKRALADEKRELDMIIYSLSNEVWKLESKLEMFQKQLEVKNVEMEKVNDKVTAYAAELEDLELEKRRLVSLWNSVLVNIQRRDKVYDSVRDDYRALQESYKTLLSNLEITKKVAMEEMNKGKEIAMNKDKLVYDITNATKLFETEDTKRLALETQISDLTESIEMTERDEELIKSENQTMCNILKSTEKEICRRNEQKLKLDSDILTNLQECLLNDKAVESMANGIKKLRELSRKQELSLMSMENQHAKMMLDIEVHRNRQARNNTTLEENLGKVREREKEIEKMEENYAKNMLVITRKQRELDIIIKKFHVLKEIFDMKSPQERRIEELEQQIRSLRERTELLQHEWLRLQGHVVKLTAHHHKIVSDINLINKQIQICEQKTMRIEAESERVLAERARTERGLRELRGRLEVLERTRRDATEKNETSQRANLAISHEYAASLKDSEMEILQIEEEIEAFEKDKMNLTQELDRIQREALIWQRKGILAVDLKKNIQNAKSAAGEIGQMRAEIHRMEVRKEQLRKTGEKLSEDLALYVTRRETAMEKSRATAAVEKAHGASGHTSQSTYHHKLRLAKADVARVTKDLAEANAHMEQLQKEQERLEREVEDTSAANSQLEEQVATLLKEYGETERQKQWLLERVVRSQRLGSELATVIKRQTLRVRKPKTTVLAEYNQAKAMNERLKNIVETLLHEYPHLSDKLEFISNTLNIHCPEDSPTLVEDSCLCLEITEEDPNIPEKLEKTTEE